MDYLRESQYYSDFYDLLTIKDCLHTISSWQETYTKHLNDNEIKTLPEEEKIKGFSYFLNWELYTTKGERYRRKERTIQEWMSRDRIKQEKYDSSITPKNILCIPCKSLMVTTDKTLWDFTDEPLKVWYIRT